MYRKTGDLKISWFELVGIREEKILKDTKFFFGRKRKDRAGNLDPEIVVRDGDLKSVERLKAIINVQRAVCLIIVFFGLLCVCIYIYIYRSGSHLFISNIPDRERQKKRKGKKSSDGDSD